MWTLKNETKKQTKQSEQTHRNREPTEVPEGGVVGGWAKRWTNV